MVEATAHQNSSMMHKWKRYPKYKDSGVEWLGEVPEGWGIKKLHRVLHRNNHKNGDSINREMLSLSAYRGIVLKEYENDNLIRPKDESLNYIIVKPGQLVVNPMWVINSSIGISKINGIVSPAYRVYDVSKEFDGTFLHNLVKTPLYLTQYNRYIRGLTTYDRSVREEDFYEIEVLIPPLPEQSTMSVFFDREIALIDTLIEKRKQQIELLNEMRATLISDILLFGISAIEELVYIQNCTPKCEFRKISTLSRVIDCLHQTPEYLDEGFPIIRITDITGEYLDLSETKKISEFHFKEFTKKYSPKLGDILLSRVGSSLGKVSIVKDNQIFCLGQNIAAILPFCNSRYLYYSFQTDFVKDQIDLSVVGSAQMTLSLEDIRKLKIPYWSPEKQISMSHFLDIVTKRVDAISRKVSESIDYLKEYRTALISAAVTGKIDVRQEISA